jgi:hypothetical protein
VAPTVEPIVHIPAKSAVPTAKPTAVPEAASTSEPRKRTPLVNSMFRRMYGFMR